MKKCLICERELETDAHGTVYEATIWRSHGNYGSSAYDPMRENRYLEAHVCDQCLIKKKPLLEEVVFQKKFQVLERKEPDFGEDHSRVEVSTKSTGSEGHP